MRRFWWLLPLSAGACTVGPNYTPPKPPVISDWRNGSPLVAEASDPDPEWWNSFADPVLAATMRRAIAGNIDVQQAVLRVVEAREGEIAAGAAALPTLNGSASYMREQLGVHGILESKGAYSSLNALADQNSPLNQYQAGLGNEVASAGDSALDSLTNPVNLYQYGLDASWELDLFGRVRRSVEQARASTQAQQEGLNDALVMLEGNVAQTYMQLRGAQTLLDTQQANISAAQGVLEITQRSQRQGLVTDLDVEQAQTELDDEVRQLPAFQKQAAQALDRLSLLVGQPPGAMDAAVTDPAPLPAIPAVVDVGVPSTLARRRPDIREAEAQLHAATANVGVAVASFYPDISLTGTLGLRALDASYLTNWASHFYTAGPTLTLPIFEGGRLRSNLRLARAEQASAALNYRETVLNALREVEDALVAYRTDRAARDAAAATVQSGEDTLYLARNRYQHGLSDFIQVLDSERQLLAARQQLAQANVTLGTDVVALYEALGGGWQTQVKAVPTPAMDASGAQF